MQLSCFFSWINVSIHPFAAAMGNIFHIKGHFKFFLTSVLIHSKLLNMFTKLLSIMQWLQLQSVQCQMVATMMMLLLTAGFSQNMLAQTNLHQAIACKKWNSSLCSIYNLLGRVFVLVSLPFWLHVSCCNVAALAFSTLWARPWKNKNKRIVNFSWKARHSASAILSLTAKHDDCQHVSFTLTLTWQVNSCKGPTGHFSLLFYVGFFYHRIITIDLFIYILSVHSPEASCSPTPDVLCVTFSSYRVLLMFQKPPSSMADATDTPDWLSLSDKHLPCQNWLLLSDNRHLLLPALIVLWRQEWIEYHCHPFHQSGIWNSITDTFSTAAALPFVSAQTS